MRSYVDKHHPRDLSIIFFSDGQDCAPRPRLVKYMKELKEYLMKKEITTRYLTIGFT